MSRPNPPALTAPTFTVRTWATDTNYPAGGNFWNSQPIKVEHPGPAGGFVPDQGIGTGYFNKLFYDAFTQDQAAKDAISDLKASLETRDAELLASFGQLQGLNWFSKNSIIISGTTQDHHFAVWDSANRKWHVALPNGRIYYSTDSAKSFPLYSAVSGISTSTTVVTGDFDAAGNGVLGRSGGPGFGTHDDNTCWECTGGTWTQRTVAGLSVDGVAVGTFYDPVHTKWSIQQIATGAVLVGAKSTDRVTWTAATMPASFGSGIVSAVSAIRKDTGRIVLVGNRSTDAKIYVAKSDDGGATFTDLVNFARPANIATFGLVHVGSGTWVCTMVATTGATTYTYKSTDDAATWTLVSTVTTAKIFSVVAVGSLLVGYGIDASSNQFAVYSTDKGTTWKHGNHVFATSGTTARGVFYGGGQVVAVTATDVSPGIRYGDPGAALT